MSSDPHKKIPLAGMLANKQQPRATPIPPSLQAKMAAMANRAAQPPTGIPMNPLHPALRPTNSSPIPSRANPPQPPVGLAGRRMKPGFTLDIGGDRLGGPGGGGGLSGAGLGAGRPNDDIPRRGPPGQSAFVTPFSNFSKIVDPSGALNFSGKAVVHSTGVNFSSGASFAINMNQLQLSEELGKGNYGTVKKVLHTPTNVVMAMKEIRLELEPSKLQSILMELDVLHRAVAPNIVEFYGAFFIESCVYYCMEYMDAGSLDKLTGRRSPFAPLVPSANPIPGMENLTVNDASSTPATPSSIWKPVPEDVLARIAASMVKGLAYLKDSLNVIHRDVKPTNVLVSRKGSIKLCDFGVSGQLEKSLAKTNIGCQSYMAPERIKGESIHAESTYTVSSDVWSLGLSIIEIGRGHYPYPPETYQNVFAQLTAIVHGDPPDLPPVGGSSYHNLTPNGTEIPGANMAEADPVGKDVGYSETAREWVASCLVKAPEGRATYAQLLKHPWLADDETREVNMCSWVEQAMAQRDALASAGELAIPHSV